MRRLFVIVSILVVSVAGAMIVKPGLRTMLVLRGAGRTLDRFHPVVIVKLIEPQLRSMGTSIAEVRAFFTAHGYAPRAEIDNNVVFAWAGGGAL